MDTSLTYGDLLLLREWKLKRSQIIGRDKKKCQICSNSSYRNDNFYGPYWIIRDEKSVYGSFSGFNGKTEQIYLRDESGIQSIDDDSKVMLYLTKHRTNGASDNPQSGYFVAAARHLNVLEIETYFPFERKGISDEEKGALMFEYVFKKKGIKEMLVDVQFDDFEWIFAKDLHVHHTYYQKGKMPWEYPDESLQTLCRSCHEKVHSENDIPVLDVKGNRVGHYSPCYRCNGAGWFPEYSHIENGICFRCRGEKYLSDRFIRQ